jgi:uncharacterized protein YjbI with pentapeptide repeats
MLSNEEEEFIRQELKYQFLGYFFEKMFFHGAVHDYRYGMFNHSKFLSCDFSDTILASTDFSNAMLVNCNFENADFRFSSLAGANIKGSKFDNCILSGTTLPDGFCSNVNEEQMEHLKKLLQAADEGSASMDGGVKE